VKIELALCLPRDVETVSLVRDVSIESLARLGITKECLEDVRLALSEACTNVIDHSGADDEYEVRLVVEDRRCEIRVIDTGGGFDFDSLGDALPDDMSPRGRGVAIMKALVDTVRFTSEPEQGTIVHLVKELELEPDGPLARLLAR
jgi:serine/threonine-protein kinase RsbW